MIALLLLTLLLTSCNSSPALFDSQPIGSAMKFVGVCILLAVIASGLVRLIESSEARRHDLQQQNQQKEERDEA